MSKPSLTEIGYQLCLVCRRRYTDGLPSHVLSCGHHFCKECLALEVSRIKKESKHEDKEEDQLLIFLQDPAEKKEKLNPKLQCPVCGKYNSMTGW